MGEKGDEVASLKKFTFWKLLIIIFNVVYKQTVKLLCIFSGELGQRFKLLATQLLQWLDYFSSF